PKATLTIRALRNGQVSGRVIDDESRQPLAGFFISLRQSDRPNESIPPAKTDAEGRFIFRELPPGRYIATTRMPESDRTWALEVFKPEDAAAMESGYEQTYWPGGLSEELASPVNLTSGGFAEIGTIVARKTTLYRALVHLTGECPKDGRIEM